MHAPANSLKPGGSNKAMDLSESDATAKQLAYVNQTLFALGIGAIDVASAGIIIASQKDFTRAWWLPSLGFMLSLGLAISSTAPDRKFVIPAKGLGKVVGAILGMLVVGGAGATTSAMDLAMAIVGWDKEAIPVQRRNFTWSLSLATMLLSALCASVLAGTIVAGKCTFLGCPPH